MRCTPRCTPFGAVSGSANNTTGYTWRKVAQFVAAVYHAGRRSAAACGVKSDQKSIRRTAIGSWLQRKAPDVLEIVGDLLPDKGGLGVLKRVIDKDNTMTGEDHEELCDLIEERLEIQNQITERWNSDNASGSWLASNVRPLIVLVLVAALLLFITLDSLALDFTVRDAWVSLYEVLTLTAVGGYFTLRSLVDKRPPKP